MWAIRARRIYRHRPKVVQFLDFRRSLLANPSQAFQIVSRLLSGVCLFWWRNWTFAELQEGHYDQQLVDLDCARKAIKWKRVKTQYFQVQIAHRLRLLAIADIYCLIRGLIRSICSIFFNFQIYAQTEWQFLQLNFLCSVFRCNHKKKFFPFKLFGKHFQFDILPVWVWLTFGLSAPFQKLLSMLNIQWALSAHLVLLNLAEASTRQLRMEGVCSNGHQLHGTCYSLSLSLSLSLSFSTLSRSSSLQAICLDQNLVGVIGVLDECVSRNYA